MSGGKSRLNTAIVRGLSFIANTARDSRNFAEYGYDYLLCFACIVSTSGDAELRQLAATLGRGLAKRWRDQHRRVPPEATADEISVLVIGSYAADRLGVSDPAFKKQLRLAARVFTPEDYFDFDPRTEPPPADVPEDCRCGITNKRHRRTCRGCKRTLNMLSRYEVWLDALVRSHFGDRYAVQVGTSCSEVVKWLPAMRPYPDPEVTTDDALNSIIYAVTHVIYVLTDFNSYCISPRLLPNELSFLKASLRHALIANDCEMVGECLDALKAFGLSEDDESIGAGTSFLLSQQDSDGSWGTPTSDDVYEKYHPTWTAVDGLRSYRERAVVRFFGDACCGLSKHGPC